MAVQKSTQPFRLLNNTELRSWAFLQTRKVKNDRNQIRNKDVVGSENDQRSGSNLTVDTLRINGGPSVVFC